MHRRHTWARVVILIGLLAGEAVPALGENGPMISFETYRTLSKVPLALSGDSGIDASDRRAQRIFEAIVNAERERPIEAYMLTVRTDASDPCLETPVNAIAQGFRFEAWTTDVQNRTLVFVFRDRPPDDPPIHPLLLAPACPGVAIAPIEPGTLQPARINVQIGIAKSALPSLCPALRGRPFMSISSPEGQRYWSQIESKVLELVEETQASFTIKGVTVDLIADVAFLEDYDATNAILSLRAMIAGEISSLETSEADIRTLIQGGNSSKTPEISQGTGERFIHARNCAVAVVAGQHVQNSAYGLRHEIAHLMSLQHEEKIGLEEDQVPPGILIDAAHQIAAFRP